MAVASYTLQTIQDRIHVLVENDPNTPPSTDDEWAVRYQLIRQAVNNWESEDVNWNELWSRYTMTATVTAGQTSYSLLTELPDFNQVGSFVKFITPGTNSYSYVEVVNPADMTKYQDNSIKVFFTGDTGNGYTLNLGWTPVAGDAFVGSQISFMYYKSASNPASVADVTWSPQMSNPDYITFWAAAQKHLMDGNTNQYSVFSGLAQENMDKMKTFNEVRPINSDMRMDDVELIKDNSSFGA